MSHPDQGGQNGRSVMSGVTWADAWNSAREQLRIELGGAVFDAWIGPLVLVSYEKGEVRIGAPKPFARNWVANHYASRIERAFTRAAGKEPASIEFVLAEQSATNGSVAPDAPCALSEPRPTRSGVVTRALHVGQSFDTFVHGQENLFPYRAARALALGENHDFHLLYLHGGFGMGKSHLLSATALETRTRGRKLLFLGAEDFMRQFLGALHRKDTLAFKTELRAADVLIIDDLQHLCSSSTTIAELLHTLNAFMGKGGQVVLAADRPPEAIPNLTNDVRSRLSGGLVIELKRPARETRLAILKARLADFVRERQGVNVPMEVLERVADIDNASPRDIIGVFTKLATYADLTKKPVTAETIEEILDQPGVGSRKTSIEDIKRKTAEFYKLGMDDFQSPERARRVARPRQVAMYLARELTMRSLPEIGKCFGDRDHTTVIHACRRVTALCDEDSLFKQEVEFLRQVLSRHAVRAAA